MNIAIIPARGGSKRIPRKNIRTFCGKPMIAWPIKAVIDSGLFDHVIVSTEDTEIAAVSKEWGAEVPFSRPVELSGDQVGVMPVINHCIQQSEQRWGRVDNVCSVYATAPLIQVDDIHRGLEKLQPMDVDFCFTACRYPYPVQRSLKVDDAGLVSMFWPEYRQSRSQDLPEAIHDAGQFYWGRRDAFLSNKGVFFSRSIPLVLPRYRVQDIDTLEDWRLAEILFSAQAESEV